jgi:hypothetical protein
MRETAPNKALEPTASSFGFAYASGGGSPRAFGGHPLRSSASERRPSTQADIQLKQREPLLRAIDG